jgi:opacity protein-like surface antigen
VKRIADRRCVGALLLVLLALPAVAAAQTDEIQVYDGGLADRGVLNLTFHTNFTPDGRKDPAFAGGVSANRSFNQVPEWAYGVTSWFEAGLYMPLYNRDNNLGWGLNGFKLRALFAVPNADDRKFVYGANFEFSVNAHRWDASRFTSEVRPIIGWHLKPWDIIVNPILDTAYDGLGKLDFAPSMRVAYNVSALWAVAAEHYADYGPLRQLAGRRDQSHQVYGVVDYNGKLKVQAGIGFGLTGASDNLTLKLIVSRDLNVKKK